MITPDRWLVIEVIKGELYKVFGTWSGSYLYGDSWRLNSGIVDVVDTDEAFIFIGNSGSEYTCLKGRYGTTSYGSGFLSEEMKVMPEDTDWARLIVVGYD